MLECAPAGIPLSYITLKINRLRFWSVFIDRIEVVFSLDY